MTRNYDTEGKLYVFAIREKYSNVTRYNALTVCKEKYKLVLRMILYVEKILVELVNVENKPEEACKPVLERQKKQKIKVGCLLATI
jgi:hypothetical protein